MYDIQTMLTSLEETKIQEVQLQELKVGQAACGVRIAKNKYLPKNKPAAKAAGQTLPNATPPVGKIHPFIKIAVTFEPIQRFRCPLRFRISGKCQYSLFYYRLGVMAP